MFTFISYWRTAAVVLCDLASTAYYIGGIVENAIGPAVPWFILAVMLPALARLFQQGRIKLAVPLPKCFEIIENGRGTHFDPRVLDAFRACQDDVVGVHINYSDA